MSKFSCILLCAVFVSLSSINMVAGGGTCREDLAPVEQECLKKHGLTVADMDAALKAKDATKIDPCFWGCYFKLLGLLNDKGQYDLSTGLANVKKYMTDDVRIAKVEETSKQCEKVTDVPVSDGDAGCEKGALIAACFFARALSDKAQ